MNVFDRASAAFNAFVSVPQTRHADVPGPRGERTRERLAKAAPQQRRRRRISPIAIDRTRWLRADIERAEHAANSGQLQQAAQIADWCKADLAVGGLLSTRCSVPRLPREWRGDDEARAWLQGEGQVPGCFDAIFPPGELEELAIDHLDLGVGVGVFVHPPSSPLPRLVRLDNQYLRYQPGEDRWQYQGYGKTYNIEPNNCDGPGGRPIQWFLHLNGEQDPWRRGIWAGLGYDQVSEDGAGLHRDGFIWRFGNPFVIAESPQGMAEHHKIDFWGAVKQWTMGFAGVTPGHKVSLLQPQATGREVFEDAEEKVERRAMLRIAGQVVTTTGGVGFANAEVFATIASHLVARTGQDLAATLNTSAIPIVLNWAARNRKISAHRPLSLGYDTTPPQAREAEAKVIAAAMQAFIAQWDAAEKANDPRLRPDPEEYRARFRLPVVADRIAAVHAAFRALTAEERAQVLHVLAPANGNGAITVQDHPTTDAQAALNGVPQQPTPPATLPAMPVGKEDEAAAPDYAETLAASLTEHAQPRCRHYADKPEVNQNRCRICGIERVDEFAPGQNGEAGSYRIKWRAIGKVAA